MSTLDPCVLKCFNLHRIKVLPTKPDKTQCGKLISSSITGVEEIKDCTYLDEELFLLTNQSEIFHKGREDEDKGRKVKVNGDQGREVKVNGDNNSFSSIYSTDKMLILQELEDKSSLTRMDVTPGRDSSNLRFAYSMPQSISIGKPVTKVSCGKEHVLLGTETGQIYTFGGGSRGQLGHGNLENVESPKLMEGLVGVTMVTMAAGGWHSTAISDLGDLYVWGWNESGQLGFPCNACKHMQKTSTERQASPDKNFHSSSSKASSSLSSHMSDQSKSQAGAVNKSPMSKYNTDVVTDVQEEVEREDVPCSDLYEPDPMESQLFIQDTGAVQVQSEPSIVDLGDDVRVKKAACGSRHTVILTEKNTVLSAGWNDYGQLCQGDTDARDYFESVNFFRKMKLNVIDVYAGAWSTVFVVDDQ
ncbi:hypothetical protein FSP39_003386 [Pinctada imbricata]|uniref:RCC1 domain-containing protein 1 n=1 Tax=Pinctada imbricata TaxID=66713 RepID=A0AA88XYZ7_PINIB|nr:hypothetical protein FSP39_003386 [Pinctada imbricata]